MAEIRDSYKLVKYIHSNAYDQLIKNSAYKKDPLGKVVKDYKKRGRLYPRKENDVYQTIAYCLTNDYIRWLDMNQTLLHVSPTKGTHLLGNKFFIYPAGRIDDGLKAYGRSQRFFTGAVVGGVIVAVLGYLSKEGLLIARSVFHWLVI